MISPWIVYLANIVDSLRFLGAILFVFAIILLFIFFFIYSAYEDEKEEKKERKKSFWEEYPHLKKSIYITLAILLLGIGLRIFVPPKEKIAGMMATKIASQQHLSIEDAILLKKKILQIINGCEGKDE